MKDILPVILLILLASSCSSEKRVIPLTEEELLPYRSCVENDDCTFAGNGCCSCPISISKDKLDEFENLFDCSLVYCDEFTCNTNVAAHCDDGLCIVAAAGGE